MLPLFANALRLPESKHIRLAPTLVQRRHVSKQNRKHVRLMYREAHSDQVYICAFLLI